MTYTRQFPSVARQATPRTYHIIIVDDDVSVRNLIKRIIERTCISFSISIAENGQDALAIYEKYGADLVVTDGDMPMMDGVGLTRIIRQSDISMPIIMVSGAADAKQKAFEAGVTAFLDKPIAAKQLADMVTCVLPR
jgi:CheY-like chemotaxis protein